MNPSTDSLSLSDEKLLNECEVDTYRASGPGGQKRNKTDSAVRLRHRPSGVQAIAEESRSQHENKARALKRLRMHIALQIRRPLDAESYQPGEAVRSCIDPAGRFRISLRNPNLPLVAREILDLLEICDYRVGDAAKRLLITTGQLSRFLTSQEHLLAHVNQERRKRGQPELRTGE